MVGNVLRDSHGQRATVSELEQTAEQLRQDILVEYNFYPMHSQCSERDQDCEI